MHYDIARTSTDQEGRQEDTNRIVKDRIMRKWHFHRWAIKVEGKEKETFPITPVTIVATRVITQSLVKNFLEANKHSLESIMST